MVRKTIYTCIVIIVLSFISCREATYENTFSPDLIVFNDLDMLLDSTKIFKIIRPKQSGFIHLYNNSQNDEFTFVFYNKDTLSKFYSIEVSKNDNGLLVSEETLLNLNTKEYESLNKILMKHGSSKKMLLRLMNFMFNNSIYSFRRILGNKTALELRMNYKDGYYYQGDSSDVVLSDCKKVKKINNYIYQISGCE